MPTTVELTLACGDYEITRPLKDGTVRPDGIDLKVVTAMDSPTRHWRFLRNREFDMAEVSSSSYIAARDNALPFRAIPVFPHRRFRHGFVFINTAKSITKPTDLIGKKVGVKFFLNSAALWLRGILQHDYGVPFKSIEWFTELDEDIAQVSLDGVRITQVPKGKTIVGMLADGELDAVLHPDLIKPLREKDPRVGRLFADHKADEAAWFKKTGIFPIMHVTVIKQEIVDKYPWVATNLTKAFEEAKNLAYRRMANPRVVPLAWIRTAWEEQEEVLGPDPWAYGLGPANRNNLEAILRYTRQQGLIKSPMTIDELFLDTDLQDAGGPDEPF
jgi:4,5-dihydroxyphthalate decarboxylase